MANPNYNITATHIPDQIYDQTASKCGDVKELDDMDVKVAQKHKYLAKRKWWKFVSDIIIRQTMSMTKVLKILKLNRKWKSKKKLLNQWITNFTVRTLDTDRILSLNRINIIEKCDSFLHWKFIVKNIIEVWKSVFQFVWKFEFPYQICWCYHSIWN